MKLVQSKANLAKFILDVNGPCIKYAKLDMSSTSRIRKRKKHIATKISSAIAYSNSNMTI